MCQSQAADAAVSHGPKCVIGGVEAVAHSLRPLASPTPSLAPSFSVESSVRGAAKEIISSLFFNNTAAVSQWLPRSLSFDNSCSSSSSLGLRQMKVAATVCKFSGFLNCIASERASCFRCAWQKKRCQADLVYYSSEGRHCDSFTSL